MRANLKIQYLIGILQLKALVYRMFNRFLYCREYAFNMLMFIVGLLEGIQQS